MIVHGLGLSEERPELLKLHSISLLKEPIMTNLFHVAVVSSRPEKIGTRNVPFASENADFVHAVLNKVSQSDYVSLSHGATEYGVDKVAEDFAQTSCIKQKQFPAYWFDPTKEKNVNKAAGIASREAMIRSLSDATYSKVGHYGMVLMFHTTPNATDDTGLKALMDFCTKYHPKIQIRTFKLPVENTKAESEQVEINLNSGTVMPDPFAAHQ